LFIEAILEPSDAKALELYRRARDLEPTNPETWYQLGAFELRYLKRPRDAYRDLNQSYTLDSYGPASLKGGPLDQAPFEAAQTLPGDPTHHSRTTLGRDVVELDVLRTVYDGDAQRGIRREIDEGRMIDLAEVE